MVLPRGSMYCAHLFCEIVTHGFDFHTTLATSVQVPAIRMIQARFDVNREVAVLLLSLYTFGVTVGLLFGAPLSELYGRRIIYWGSVPLLLAFTAGTGAAQNIETFITCQELMGLFRISSTANGAGTITDIWILREMEDLQRSCLL